MFHTVRKPETFRDRKQGRHGKKRGAFLHLFGHDSPSSLRDHSVYLSKNIRCEYEVCQATELRKVDRSGRNSLAAWMSHEYMANINLGDQSSSPFLHASRTEVISDPDTCA